VTFAITQTIGDISLCELTTAGIGIIYRYGTAVRYKTLSVTGTQVADASVFTDAAITSGPFVIKLANNTYLMVYVKLVGSDYKFYRRTSSNFTAWSAESECVVGGLTSTKRTAHPSLEQITTGDIFLSFDYLESVGPSGEELTNIYYSISASPNYGVTWANAVKLTAYTDYTAKATTPLARQKAANSLHLVYSEERPVMAMDYNALGWDAGDNIHYIYVDEVNNKCILTIIGHNGDPGIVKIDIPTWTVDKCWYGSSTPAFDAYFMTETPPEREDCKYQGDGPYSVLVDANAGYPCSIAVLNTTTEDITYYHTCDHDGYTKNIGWTPDSVGNNEIYCLRIDATTNRMYLWLHATTSQVGYIDLTEALPAGGLYTWNLLSSINLSGYVSTGVPWVQIYPDSDFVMWGEPGYHGIGGNTGRLVIWQLSTGALYKNYIHTSDPAFPFTGINHYIFDEDHKIYATFTYNATVGDNDEDKRGLMEINLTTDAISFYRPSWASIDDYTFNRLCLNAANELWITTESYGVTKFDILTQTWEWFDHSNFAGFPETAYRQIIYDEANDLVFAVACWGDYDRDSAIVAFSKYGYLKRSYYSLGTYTASWAFVTATPLVIGFNDYDATIAFEPTTTKAMVAFWVNKDSAEESIKWDKESGAFDLADYLVKGEEYSYEKSIDGSPNKLEFTVSHGYLFDPHNSNSLLNIYLKKGRKLTLSEGETIAAVDYWQQIGEFVVSRCSVSYKRPDYPAMKVEAEDKRGVWDQTNCDVTDGYNNYPEDIIEDVVPEYSDFELADIDLPVIANRILLDMQWIDTSLADIVKQVCHRFGYFPCLTYDGKLTARKISDSNAVDHVYSDTTKIINFTPDDDFSDYTNQITVEGEEQDWIEVLYPEERITALNGTVGWWGFHKDIDVYYSDDKQRTCRTPRLKVIETATSIAFKLAGSITEEISYIDPDDKYCTVTITAPNLIPELVAGLAILIGSYFSPDVIIAPSGGGPCAHKRVGSYFTALGAFICLNILGAVGNYQYEVWAKPVGKVRRTCQYVEDDTAFQQQVNMIVPKKYTDPMCYTVAHCKLVAEFEMLITQLQRRRVKFSKIAHLQDEEGDTIQIPHPYTLLPMTIFIPYLKRKTLIPEKTGDEGYRIDEIEGWKI
jgi:hypothetical protein